MIEAGVREVKNHLSQFLRRARAGERVVITDRGRAVAALVAIEDGGASELGWELVRQGLGEWGGGKPKGLANPPSVRGRRAEEVVLEDRR